MKNASFTPTECLLSCLSGHAGFWHEAFSFGRWETRNTSTSLCQTSPVSQGRALRWPGWQWQTDNGWMLHFTEKSSYFLLFSVEPKREEWVWLRKITFISPRTFYMKTYGLIRYFTGTGQCCSRTQFLLGSPDIQLYTTTKIEAKVDLCAWFFRIKMSVSSWDAEVGDNCNIFLVSWHWQC